MNAPLGRTPEKMLGRCECAVQCGVYEPGAGHHFKGKCPRDAVRLVTVRVEVEQVEVNASVRVRKFERQTIACCEPCAKHHGSRASRDERGIHCACGKPKLPDAVACDSCLGRASHTERTTAKGGRE